MCAERSHQCGSSVALPERESAARALLFRIILVARRCGCVLRYLRTVLRTGSPMRCASLSLRGVAVAVC